MRLLGCRMGTAASSLALSYRMKESRGVARNIHRCSLPDLPLRRRKDRRPVAPNHQDNCALRKRRKRTRAVPYSGKGDLRTRIQQWAKTQQRNEKLHRDRHADDDERRVEAEGQDDDRRGGYKIHLRMYRCIHTYMSANNVGTRRS